MRYAPVADDHESRHSHAGLDVCLGDAGRPPLERVRGFFEMTQKSYRKEGYMGCLLGGLGQELSGVSPAQPSARKCRAADRHARLLLPIGSQSMSRSRAPGVEWRVP